MCAILTAQIVVGSTTGVDGTATLGIVGRTFRTSGGACPVVTTEEALVAVTDTAPVHHPAVTEHQQHRAADAQLRVADAITKFAGSMMFVYVHVVLFVAWMLIVEKNPWPTLTLGVSLEAIFLSTFVMIGQNRQADFAQRKADHDFNEQEVELKLNTELTKQVHALAQEIHRYVTNSPTPPAA